MYVPFQREVMCIIERFVEEALPGKSPWTKENVLYLVHIFPLDKIPKIKMCRMAAMEHPESIEGRRPLIAVYILESEEAAEYASIDRDDAALDEEDGSGLAGAGVTEEVEDTHKAFKYSSLLSYMLKPYHLITQGFEKNRMA